MTTQEYISANAPIFAARHTGHDAKTLCKEIRSLCGCTANEAVKTLIATFDEALKIRENEN